MTADIRKIVTVVEETLIEGGRAVIPPTKRAAAVAVVKNPFAGDYIEDLAALADMGEELGQLLARSQLLAFPAQPSRASARQRRSAPTASSSTPRPFSIRSSGRPSGACSARALP